MKFLVLIGTIFVIGCASNMKVITVSSNQESKVVFLDRKICNSPCSIKIKETDSSVVHISATSLKNYFTKHTALTSNMFQKDTTINFEF